MSQAQEPAVVADYFGTVHTREHALVAEVFKPSTGWTRSPVRKRINPTWARKARREGVTAVAVRCGARLADFQITELVR